MLDDALDEWLAEVDALQRKIDRPLERPDLRPHAYALAQGLAAVRQARWQAIPSIILEEATWLARFVVAATRADREPDAVMLEMLDLRAQVAAWRRYAETLDGMLDASGDKDAARVAALEAARERRAEELKTKLDALRPEYQRLRDRGLSARRAADILAVRFGLSAETIRKRLP